MQERAIGTLTERRELCKKTPGFRLAVHSGWVFGILYGPQVKLKSRKEIIFLTCLHA